METKPSTSTSKPRMNRVELWLDQLDDYKKEAFVEYATECQSFEAMLAYLVQEGATDIHHADLMRWMKGLMGNRAKFQENALGNKDYLGISTAGTLDRIVYELSDQLDLVNARITSKLECGHPLYDEMTTNGAMKYRSELLRDLKAATLDLEKRRATTEKHSMVWAVAARLRNLFMNHEMVRDTEHESWCDELWNYSLGRLEDELKRIK